MKFAGKAMQAGFKLIIAGLALVLVLLLLARLVGWHSQALTLTLVAVWALFVVFTLYFFRDPTPRVPVDPAAYVSPAHGTVDWIDEAEEPVFVRGQCRRISIFLSVFDVHVQQAPVAGKIVLAQHTPGKFLNAIKADCSKHNENVLLGIESSEAPGEKVAVRLIAGLIARRIVPWVAVGDAVERGGRTSLIQFGSRVDLFLPLSARLNVKLGDKVVGGETILARRG